LVSKAKPLTAVRTQPKFPLKGEIWYVKIPNQPEDPHQPRPAIIISRDVRNQFAKDVMIVPVFGKPSRYNDSYVTIPEKQGGLKKNSTAKCDQATTISKQLLATGPLGGRIDLTLMRQIHYAIRRALGETRVP
jgi:mRNA-degrading endonuclease toxin of MazEF toxin-antitoxin module